MNPAVETPPPDAGLADRLDDFIRYAEVKRLAGAIASLQRRKPFRALAVLSVEAGDGKTLLCAALARVYAQTCRSPILIIDAGGRRTPQSLELAACLERSPAVYCVRVGDGPPPSPAAAGDAPPAAVAPQTLPELQDGDSALIRQALGEFPGPYGLILIDTEPLVGGGNGNVDPVLVARAAGAAVLVVGRRSLKSAALEGSLELLRDPGIRLLGLVANERHGR